MYERQPGNVMAIATTDNIFSALFNNGQIGQVNSFCITGAFDTTYKS